MKKKEGNNLVFFAMGEMYNKQCFYAILSLINVYNRRVPEWLQIYVYTDNPDFFSLLDQKVHLTLITITEDTVREWRLGNAYFFITKISMVKEFLINHPGNMVFVDTDVIFKRKLDTTFQKISNGDLVLHLRESKFSEMENKHFLDSFEDKQFNLNSGRTITVNRKTEMWNSGLIGCRSSRVDLIDDVLELCIKMELYSSSRVLEQLAFSLVFKDEGPLVDDRNKLVHYWWKKRVFNPVVNEVVNTTNVKIEDMLGKAEKLDPTNRNLALRFFYGLHPNGLLRKSIVKGSLLLNMPIR